MDFRSWPYGVSGYSAGLDAVAQYDLTDVAGQITTPLYIVETDGEQPLPREITEQRSSTGWTSRSGDCDDNGGVVTVEDVRALALTLPRTTEHLVHDRVKFRVKQIVYCAFSRDETMMGFAFPKEERDGLIAAEPALYLLPPTVGPAVQLGGGAGRPARPRHHGGAGVRRVGDVRAEVPRA